MVNESAEYSNQYQDEGARPVGRGVKWYLLFAFGGAWIAWAVPMLAGVSVTSPWFQLAALPGAFCPAISAVVVRRFITREGFKDARLRINFSAWRYYLVAWLLPLGLLSFVVVAAGAARVAYPDYSIAAALRGLAHGRPLLAHVQPYLGLLIVPQLLLTAVIAAPILWGEEFGWRGYLQPRLFPGRPGLAAAATGVIWGAWHFPLIINGYDFPGHPALSMMTFIVSTVLLSVVFGWLLERSQSIWAPSLAHSAMNAVGAGLSTLWFYGQADPILTSILGVLVWPPLLVLTAWILATRQLHRQETSGLAGTRRAGEALS